MQQAQLKKNQKQLEITRTELTLFTEELKRSADAQNIQIDTGKLAIDGSLGQLLAIS
jgi:hypothetical protein